MENIRKRRVFPDVTPGYIRQLLPSEAPDKGEKWDDIFKDVERVIMPGVGIALKAIKLKSSSFRKKRLCKKALILHLIKGQRVRSFKA